MSERGLIIHHNIYLTREDRYRLDDGEEVTCIGISTPVWCNGRYSSEPAREIYCQYTIRNFGEEMPVAMNVLGYDISLPLRPCVMRNVSNKRWRAMSDQEREQFYSLFKNGASSANLIDVADGGSACLMYPQTMHIKHVDGKQTSILHLIQIRDISVLEASISIKPGWAGSPIVPSKAGA